MMISDLTKKTPENHVLESYQQQNLSSLLEMSLDFSRQAGFECDKIPSVQEDTIVLESGHQPNFFPYSGVWKKVFLLHRFRDLFAQEEVSAISLFGFADQNAATAPYLYKNQVPALNRKGIQRIGFTMKGPEKWKRFDAINKPPLDIWEHEMAELEKIYPGMKSVNKEIMEIMWESYERAKSFSDMNAFIFSRISREILGLNVFFFRYSDVQRNRLFNAERKKILDKLDTYNLVYNGTIEKENLKSRTVVSGEIPFWYHCDCGGKLSLVANTFGVCRGECPICKKEHELDLKNDFSQFEKYSQKMSCCAVSRNLIFSEGLGTHFFISGTGGSLGYGKISYAISSVIGFNQPLTFSWSSRDYYVGNIHKNAVKELKRTFSLTKADLLDASLNERITECRKKMGAKVAELEAKGADKKSLQLYSGRFIGSAGTIGLVSGIFSAVPSMFDIYMNCDTEDILESWNEAVSCSVMQEYNSSCTIAEDSVYRSRDISEFTPAEIPVLYHNLSAIGVKE